MNLDFLLQPLDFAARATMTVESLAPLSMVTSLPGKYYRCQPAPTFEMLLGMIENALGWHVSTRERKRLIAKLQAKHGGTASQTGVGFTSLLHFHLRLEQTVVPPLMHYDDLWAQHLKHTDERHINGSRQHDHRAIPVLNEVKSGVRTLNPAELIRFFPQYYVSPTRRGYVEPQGAYKFVFATSGAMAERIGAALDDPAAPLYLGSNDGWVDVRWEVMT